MRSVGALGALGLMAAHRDTWELIKASSAQQTFTLSCMSALPYPSLPASIKALHLSRKVDQPGPVLVQIKGNNKATIRPLSCIHCSSLLFTNPAYVFTWTFAVLSQRSPCRLSP